MGNEGDKKYCNIHEKTPLSCPKVRLPAKPSDGPSFHLRPAIRVLLLSGCDSTPTQYLLQNQHRTREENQLWANIWFFFSPLFTVLVNILSEAVCCTTDGLKETAVCRELI